MSSKIKNLVLSLTGECNYSCLYCYASEHNKSEMTFEIAKKAIDIACKDNSQFIIQFSGGEPLIAFKLIEKIVDYVEKNKLNVIFQLQTNGSLITNNIARFMKTHRVGIGVSLDGRPDINDLQRKLSDGRGTSTETLRGIKSLSDNGIAIGLTCVITNKNVEELKGIVEIAYYLGNVRKIGFDLLRGQGRGKDLFTAKPKLLEKSLKEVYDLANDLAKVTRVKIQFTQIDVVKQLKKDGLKGIFAHCDAMTGETAFIDAIGNIYACPSLVGNPDFYMGNVDEGIDECKVRTIKSRIENSMNICRNCKDLNECGGGCFARFFGNGKVGVSLEECALKRISIEYANKMIKY